MTHYQNRRQRLLDAMPAESLAILPGASLVTRSRDTEYPFRQNSDFWYLTGFNEPDAWLVLHKTTEKTTSHVFVLPKDPKQEVWTGRRLGPEAAPQQLGVDQAWSVEQLDEQLATWLGGVNSVWMPFDDAALYPRWLSWRSLALKKGQRKACLPQQLVDLSGWLAEQRLIKDEQEQALMRRAAEISAQAHVQVMRTCRPGLFEYQLQAQLEAFFVDQGASGPAYASIVGSGANACILHYIDNQKRLEAGELVLIDAGAEYQGYAGDITRTFPVSGRFSPPQRQLYDWVLAANEAAIALVRPGVTLEAIHQKVLAVLTEGLLSLGLIQGDLNVCLEQEAWRPFFMHGTGHWLGLDVHDVGRYRQQGQPRALQRGMVLTIEPGLYIAEDELSVAPEWRGIGIRIEDNLLVTASGAEVLTQGVPKQADAIEALMAEPAA